jgi:hypothetical protein
MQDAPSSALLRNPEVLLKLVVLASVIANTLPSDMEFMPGATPE